MRHYQNLSEHGALPPQFVATCILQILDALVAIHKEGLVHCNLDLDNIMVMKTPFGGDHFKLVNFDSARIKGSDVHPVFPNAKARLQPFVSPEIAETPLDARRKPELSCAADIWSLGVITFIMRSACLPMNRENNATPADPKAPKFDPEGIINSAQYGRIFDEDQRDFLIKCMQQDPLKRATAEELRKHKWIIKNELEVKR